LKKTLKKFSRGMVMKAAIALALSHHADLIIDLLDTERGTFRDFPASIQKNRWNRMLINGPSDLHYLDPREVTDV
jgi:ABC-type Na+ transport system ATPase subunit NatA